MPTDILTNQICRKCRGKDLTVTLDRNNRKTPFLWICRECKSTEFTQTKALPSWIEIDYGLWTKYVDGLP